MNSRIWLLLPLVLALLTLSDAAAQSPRWQDSYAAVLDDALTAVRRGEAARAAGILAGVNKVPMPEGYALPVDNGDLVSMLSGPAPDMRVVEARLKALLVEVEAAPDLPQPDPAVFAALDAVLARPEFQPAPPNADGGPNVPARRVRITLNHLLVGGTCLGLVVIGMLIYGLRWAVARYRTPPGAGDQTGGPATTSHAIRGCLVRVALVLLALSVGFAVFVFAYQPEGDQFDEPAQVLAYSTHSTAPSGTKALSLWLDALGYRTASLEYSAFVIPAATDLAVAVEPKVGYELSDAMSLAEWVSSGGTLVGAADINANELLRSFGALFVPLSSPVAPVVRQPFFNHPPVVGLLAPANSGIDLPLGDAVVYVTGETSPGKTTPTLISRRFGRGKIYLTTQIDAFTNDGLRSPANAALVYNLLRDVPPGGQIIFDEYHHGFIKSP